MKKNRILLLSIALVFCMAVQAQNASDSLKSTMSVNMGFSAIEALVVYSGSEDDPQVHIIPAIQFNYDYSLNRWISVGVNISDQAMKVTYMETDGGPREERYNRFNMGGQVLVHYLHTSRTTLYSGFRMGFTHWNNNYRLSSDSFSEVFINKNSASPQFVAFGVKQYFTRNFGFNAELAIGSPHFFSVGLSYRM